MVCFFSSFFSRFARGNLEGDILCPWSLVPVKLDLYRDMIGLLLIQRSACFKRWALVGVRTEKRLHRVHRHRHICKYYISILSLIVGAMYLFI